jgi:peptidyl-prolyl cis-trans isomerase C
MLRTTVLLSLFTLAALSSCGGDRTKKPAAAAPPHGQESGAVKTAQPSVTPVDIAATVNGVPISEAEIEFKLKKNKHIAEATPEARKNVLNAVVQEELVFQRAAKLGFEADASYQEALRHIEAQSRALKREELGKVFQRELSKNVTVSEEEAQKYFESATLIRTELHVWQILARDEGALQQALRDIQGGKPFEEVAAGRFPKIPETGPKPWDLGYLKWQFVPISWRDVVNNMKIGEVSGIIRGQGRDKGRFWIIKIIDRREDPKVTFDAIKPTIIGVLRNEKFDALLEQTRQDLWNTAKVDYSSPKPGNSAHVNDTYNQDNE